MEKTRLVEIAMTCDLCGKGIERKDDCEAVFAQRKKATTSSVGTWHNRKVWESTENYHFHRNCFDKKIVIK